MERLTVRKGRAVFLTENTCNMCGYAEKRSSTFCENLGCPSTKDRTCPYLQLIDRLADYEDTGLTPLQITDMITCRSCDTGEVDLRDAIEAIETALDNVRFLEG